MLKFSKLRVIAVLCFVWAGYCQAALKETVLNDKTLSPNINNVNQNKFKTICIKEFQHYTFYTANFGPFIEKDCNTVSKGKTRAIMERGMGQLYNNLLLSFLATTPGYTAHENYIKVVYWFTLAAKHGDEKAQLELGLLYRGLTGPSISFGKGANGKRAVIKKNYAKAKYWYERAAKQGNAGAQADLGFMSSRGLGGEQDYKKAKYWSELAAKQGDVVAQFNLGLLYGQGHGVSKNYVMAYKWLNLSASSGYKDSIKMRNLIEHLMSSQQITEGQRLSYEFEQSPHV